MTPQARNVESVSKIVGHQLSSVAFTKNYLELSFDSRILTLLTPVSVHSPAGVVRQSNPGWRDALCSQLAHIVSGVGIRDDKLCVDFDTGFSIAASLRSEDYPGPEAIIFKDGSSLALFGIDDV
jgi:hypothetical protein